MLEKYYNKKTMTLTLPINFNSLLEDLPIGIKKIIFENNEKYVFSEFNKKVDNLPSSLTHLTFGCKFNQEVDNLPSSLTHLTFGYYFDQIVDNLPSSLTHLTFGYWFNEKVDNLPSSLTHLTFGYNFNQKLDNLPSSLKEINIWKGYVDLYQMKIPFGCKVVDERTSKDYI